MDKQNVIVVFIQRISGKDVVVPYETEKHIELAYKFIYMDADEQRGTGPILAIGDEKREYSHNQIHACLVQHNLVAARTRPIGAGYVIRGGIEGWRSQSFEINTPDTLKPIISELLGFKQTRS